MLQKAIKVGPGPSYSRLRCRRCKHEGAQPQSRHHKEDRGKQKLLQAGSLRARSRHDRILATHRADLTDRLTPGKGAKQTRTTEKMQIHKRRRLNSLKQERSTDEATRQTGWRQK